LCRRRLTDAQHKCPDGDGKSRLLWTIDMLPNELAAYVQEQTRDAVIALHKAFPPAAA